jgi:hypothetical protein
MHKWPRIDDYAGADRLINRTWQINTTLALRISELAESQQVTHSSLVRLLLTRAMDDIDAGRLRIRREPVLWRAILE